jgi:WhiB family redox-sensing transcriptional regulator
MKSSGEPLPCESDPELFFPIGQSGPNLRQIEEAKRKCGSCAVQAQCLALSLEYTEQFGDLYGVWGGVDEWERKRAFTRSRQGAPQQLGALVSRATIPNPVQERDLPATPRGADLSNMLNPDRLLAHQQPGAA